MGRTCSTCKTEKQDEDFPTSKATKSGFDYRCKACHRAKWKLRNPPKVEIFSYPDGFTITKESVKVIFDLQDGALKWRVNTPSARAGDVAGTSEANRSSRVFVNGQRFTVDDLKSLWLTGEIPERAPRVARNVVFEAEWMKEIRSHRIGFDWSCIWKAEQNRRKVRAAYEALSPDDRRASWREKASRRDPLKMAETKKNWRINNPEANREHSRRAQKRFNAKPENKPKRNLRNRFKDLMDAARVGGSGSFSKLIGCTTAQLARHLQSKFKRGMTWSNYGTHWHVDHILPCASFDHSIQSQVQQCWHYTNLAPLEAEKNLAKRDKIIHPQMSLCL